MSASLDVRLWLKADLFEVTLLRPLLTQSSHKARTVKLFSIKYNKKSIPCCWHLKEKPFLQWLKKHRSLDMLVVSGIAGYEGWQRQAFLSQLRKRNRSIS